MEMIRITLIFFIAAAALIVAAGMLGGCQSSAPRYEVWRFDKHFRPYRVM